MCGVYGQRTLCSKTCLTYKWFGADVIRMRCALQAFCLRLPVLLFLRQLIYLPSNQQTAVTSRRRLLIRFPETLSHPHPRTFLPLTSGATSVKLSHASTHPSLLSAAVGEYSCSVSSPVHRRRRPRLRRPRVQHVDQERSMRPSVAQRWVS